MTDAPTRAGPPMTAIPLPEPPYFDPQALRVELTGLFQSHGSADAARPHVIERLLGPKPAMRRLLMPGIMTIALGVGVGVSSALTIREDMGELFKRLGNAAILICLGVGLIVSSRLDNSDRSK